MRGINMFKVMYYDYEPYVTISTEKYGISKIKLLATCLADIINNSQQVLEEQRKRITEEEEAEHNKQKTQGGSLEL